MRKSKEKIKQRNTTLRFYTASTTIRLGLRFIPADAELWPEDTTYTEMNVCLFQIIYQSKIDFGFNLTYQFNVQDGHLKKKHALSSVFIGI